MEQNISRRQFGKLTGALASTLLGSNAGAQENYIRPKEAVTIPLEKANFSEKIFPEKLGFPLGRTTLVVNAVWQTAVLYDRNGYKMYYDKDKKKPIQFQVGTGAPDTPTKVMLYQVKTHNDEKYRSHSFGPDGKLKKGQSGSLMAYAKHLGEVFIAENGEVKSYDTDGTAIHKRLSSNKIESTAFVSHACIGLPGAAMEFLQNALHIGDFVMVTGEEFPVGNNIEELIVQLKKDNEIYKKYVKTIMAKNFKTIYDR